MSTVNDLLVVSMLADGPYWQSALEVLAPPAEVTFYRAFSYRVEWVDNSVLDKVADGGSLGPLDAVVGMRFRSRDDEGQLISPARFIPLRLAEAVVTRSGDLSVRLKLGEFVATDRGSGDFRIIEIPDGVNEKDERAVLLRLATDSERELASSWQTSAVPDHRIWQRLADSQLLPEQVRDRFRDQVVLYARDIRDIKSGATLRAHKIHTDSNSKFAVYGYKFRVGHHYEVALESRRICEPGAKDFPSSRPQFKLMNDPSTLISSAPTIPFTGNYREMPSWVLPRHRVDAPLDLWWQPEPTAGATKISSQVGLRIPFVSKPVVPWKPILLALLFLLTGVVSYWQALAFDIDATAVAVLLSVGTLLVSLGASQVVESVRRWDDQSQ